MSNDFLNTLATIMSEGIAKIELLTPEELDRIFND